MRGMTALSDGACTSARAEQSGDHREACSPGSSGVALTVLTEATRSEPAGQGEAEVTLNSLVARAVHGDQGATQELLATVRAMVLPYCRARLGRQQRVISSAEVYAVGLTVGSVTTSAINMR
jgi:hypothetical protein